MSSEDFEIAIMLILSCVFLRELGKECVDVMTDTRVTLEVPQSFRSSELLVLCLYSRLVVIMGFELKLAMSSSDYYGILFPES